jgi:hypothetical protein
MAHLLGFHCTSLRFLYGRQTGNMQTTRTRVGMKVDEAALVKGEAEIRKIQIDAIQRRMDRAFEKVAGLPADAPPWLWRLRIEGDLSHPEIRQKINQALNDNNPEVLLDAAKMKQATSITDADIKKEIAKLDELLLWHWLARDGAEFYYSLCYYNDTALAKLCAIHMGQNPTAWSNKYIRKVCEKLGLSKAKTLLFKGVRVEGGDEDCRITPVPYVHFMPTGN